MYNIIILNDHHQTDTVVLMAVSNSFNYYLINFLFITKIITLN